MIESQVTIRCPHCGGTKQEEMPVDACIYLYQCTYCGQLLRPQLGDCCVFCSYGDRRCPPRQAEAQRP